MSRKSINNNNNVLNTRTVYLSISASKISENALKKWGRTSCIDIFEPSSLLIEVTVLPSSPQGTMCSNHTRSLLQFRAKPCVVTCRP